MTTIFSTISLLCCCLLSSIQQSISASRSFIHIRTNHDRSTCRVHQDYLLDTESRTDGAYLWHITGGSFGTHFPFDTNQATSRKFPIFRDARSRDIGCTKRRRRHSNPDCMLRGCQGTYRSLFDQCHGTTPSNIFQWLTAGKITTRGPAHQEKNKS